ncbi:MAG TPA: methyltransferase domain-containing protein [Fibrobacteria bacterium]|nr:methyltransferase domain-containing protein [Fibrobacteria bacterium]
MADTTGTDRFDALAREWDLAPHHVRRTTDIADLLNERIPLAGMSALEVGAGTGLLSFALAGRLSRVVASDPSQGMVDILEDKIRQSGIGNIASLRCGDDLDGVDGPFDLVLLQMALHHVPDPRAFLGRAAGKIRQGGWIAVADLDTEDGSFHGPDVADIHFGFKRSEIVEWFALAGFEPISIETVHTMSRQGPQGSREYPIFLATARKR